MRVYESIARADAAQGVGIVVAIGAHTQDSPVQLGDRVGIKWLADSCLDCELCRKGLEQCESRAAPILWPRWSLVHPLLASILQRRFRPYSLCDGRRTLLAATYRDAC